VEGQCNQLVCEAGYDDCDMDKTNGCERPLGTPTDCSGCDKACVSAHAQGICTMGSCQLGMCDSGFDNCDNDMNNGCEAALTTPEHCGACNMACPAGAPCINGMCGCAHDSDCSDGRQCCSGQCINTDGQCSLAPCLLSPSRNENRANCGGCGVHCDYCCGRLFN
jgi:hypothetical protein